MIVVDTSVFSLFLRRQAKLRRYDPAMRLFKSLLEKDQVTLLGVVYQELLSGIKTTAQFDQLNQTLLGFDIIYADQNDHQVAAEFYNRCRQNGVQGSSFDFLICAMAANRDYPILTTDQDFENYAGHIDIALLAY